MAPDDSWRGELWDAIGRGLAAHAVMLRDSAIVDDSIAGSLLTAIDGARRGAPADVLGSLALVGAFDDRVDSLVAAGARRVKPKSFTHALTLPIPSLVGARRGGCLRGCTFSLLPAPRGEGPGMRGSLCHC